MSEKLHNCAEVILLGTCKGSKVTFTALALLGMASLYAISMVITYWSTHPPFHKDGHDKEAKL